MFNNGIKIHIWNLKNLPLAKFIGGGAGGGAANAVGDGVIPEGSLWTRLLLLEGNWPSKLSWSTNSLPAENRNKE